MQEERARNVREMEVEADARRACKERTWIKDGRHFIFLHKNRIHRCGIDGEVKNYYHHRPWYKVCRHESRLEKL